MLREAFALLNLALIIGAAGIGMRLYFRAHPEPSNVRGSRLLSSRVRAWYFSNLEPFELLFSRLGVPAAALSYAQLVASVISGWAYAKGLIFAAGWLVLFTGTLDILDGKVARRTNGDSRRGAFLDSVIDRYVEFASYAGLIAFYQSGWMDWAVLLAIFGGTMVSYTRARAEGLGIRCEIGWLQRPERFVLLGFGSIFSAIAAQGFGGLLGGDRHVILGATIVLLAVLSNATALQRAVHAWGNLEGPSHG